MSNSLAPASTLDHPAVQAAWKNLQGKADYLSEKDHQRLEAAFRFGADAHKSQFRKSGEPYITHPLTVAAILADHHMDIATLCAGILHDTIEDTDVTAADLERYFGKTVTQLVEAVTKLDKLKFRNLKEAQAESFVKMLFAMAQDIRVILIKLADRLHNMRTIEAMSESARKRIARETLDVFAPIAERLGLKQVQHEMEDHAFRALHPNVFEEISEKVREFTGKRQQIMDDVKRKLARELRHSGLNAKLLGRQKSIYSIWRKMREKNRPFEQIYDIFGVRIIVDEVKDCYVTLGILHNMYPPNEKSFKDYIAVPKSNGYQSLHTVVTGPYGLMLEAQIRTESMDLVCENGVAAHWLYKNEDAETSSRLMAARNWLNNLLKLQKDTGSSLEFYENMKRDLITDEIYVFTPRGDIVQLPKKSTVLDFAYAIHTDVGNHAVAAEVNNAPASLKQKLRTGQTVRIETDPHARPRTEWLQVVATSKARTAIRQALKQVRDEEAILVGHRMLDRALDTYGYSFEKLDKRSIRRVLKEYRFENMDELLKSIALGEQLPSLIARKLLPLLRQRGLGNDYAPKEALSITGDEGSIIHYPNCCQPVPGDDIVGYLSPSKGIVIHRCECPNVEELQKNPERMVNVNWDRQNRGAYRSTLELDVINKPGVLAKLAGATADMGTNIESVRQVDRDGDFTGLEFVVSVHNLKELEAILRQLRQYTEVLRAERKRP